MASNFLSRMFALSKASSPWKMLRMFFIENVSSTFLECGAVFRFETQRAEMCVCVDLVDLVKRFQMRAFQAVTLRIDAA